MPAGEQARGGWHGGGALAALLLVAAAVYARTLGVPWYFDDLPIIVENWALRDLGATAAGFLAPRGPVDLTFALNLRLHGAQVAGFHLVNVALHLANGALLFLLLGRVFRDRPLPRLAAVAVFLLHPLQTQAVTYVVQRYTLAAATCALAALLAVVRWGEEPGFPFRSPRAAATWLGALLLGALAVLCKQNTATLFLVAPLLCVLFVRREWKPGTLLVALAVPFAAVPLLLGIHQLLLPLATGASLGEVTGILAAGDAAPQPSPILYFATEWRVAWLYLRLLVLPWGQALDYGFPLATAVVTAGNLAALAGLCALLWAGWGARRRFPATSFGIAWFFAFLLVESTFIPLDPAFEHRLYLPLAGFAIVAADWLARIPGRRTAPGTAVIACLLLGVLAWQRNELWRTPSALLIDNVERRPGDGRVYAGAADALAAEGKLEQARELLRRGVSRGLGHEAIYVSLVRILVAEGSFAEAVASGEEGLRRHPASVNLLWLAGLAEDLRGNPARSAELHLRAIALQPRNPQGYNNLGASLEKQGRPEEAAAAYRRAIELDPAYAPGHYNLGVALYGVGKHAEAVVELSEARRLGWELQSIEALVVIRGAMGERAVAEGLLRELESLDPERGMGVRARLGW